MKSYVKPIIEFIELKPDERLAKSGPGGFGDRDDDKDKGKVGKGGGTPVSCCSSALTSSIQAPKMQSLQLSSPSVCGN